MGLPARAPAGVIPVSVHLLPNAVVQEAPTERSVSDEDCFIPEIYAAPTLDIPTPVSNRYQPTPLVLLRCLHAMSMVSTISTR